MVDSSQQVQGSSHAMLTLTDATVNSRWPVSVNVTVSGGCLCCAEGEVEVVSVAVFYCFSAGAKTHHSGCQQQHSWWQTLEVLRAARVVGVEAR